MYFSCYSVFCSAGHNCFNNIYAMCALLHPFDLTHINEFGRFEIVYICFLKEISDHVCCLCFLLFFIIFLLLMSVLYLPGCLDALVLWFCNL
jgi:hypothetical protein